MSNFLENALINATLRNTTYTSVATVYVSLWTTDPTDAGSGTEVSGGSYARTAVTFGAPSNGVTTNSADVTFPTAIALYDRAIANIKKSDLGATYPYTTLSVTPR